MAPQLAPTPPLQRWPLAHTELACLGQLFGPPELVALVQAVIAQVGPAWQAQFERNQVPKPGILNILVQAPSSAAAGNSGSARTLAADAVIELSFASSISAARLRHLVIHELAHVFINQLAGDQLPGRGLIGEYAAERMSWQIARDSGLRPGRDVSVEVYRKTHRAWLRPLVMIADRIGTDPVPGRPEMGPRYTRDLKWLHAGAAQIANAEAYRLGQIDGGIKLRNPRRHFEPLIPAALDAALAELFAPLTAADLPPDADGQAWRAFLRLVGPRLVRRGANIGSLSLLSLIEADRGEFLSCARARGRGLGASLPLLGPARIEDGAEPDKALLRHLRGQLVLARLTPGAGIVDALQTARSLSS